MLKSPTSARSNGVGRRRLSRRISRLDTDVRQSKDSLHANPETQDRPDCGRRRRPQRFAGAAVCPQGIRVALAARQIEKLGALCSETGARAYACNATDAESSGCSAWSSARSARLTSWSTMPAPGRAARSSTVPADVARAIAISGFGGFLVAQQAAKRMLPNKHGAILFTGASASVKGFPHSATSPWESSPCAGWPSLRRGNFSPGNPCRAFRDRRRYPQRRAREPVTIPTGSSIPTPLRRPTGTCCTAAQRLELGARSAAVGGEVLDRHGSSKGLSPCPTNRSHGPGNGAIASLWSQRSFGPSRNDKRVGSDMTTETTIDTGTNELLCVIRDRVAIITLNRPEARNSMSDRLTPALRTMIRSCGENPNVGVLLITGAGTAFCAGGDVKGMGAHRDQGSSRCRWTKGRRPAGTPAAAHRRAGLGAQADHRGTARRRGRRRSRHRDGLRHPHRGEIGLRLHRLYARRR